MNPPFNNPPTGPLTTAERLGLQGNYTPKTISIADDRKVNATTGKPINPNVDLVKGDYREDTIKNVIYNSLKNRIDPYTGLAVAMQESKIGNTDTNLGHVLGSRYIPNSANFTKIIKEKQDYAKKLGFNNEATQIQAYNGLGKISPNQVSYGSKLSQVYGVTVPKEGIDMKKNPLYGKRIIDLRDNVIKKNVEIKSHVDKISNGFYNSLYGAPIKPLDLTGNTTNQF